MLIHTRLYTRYPGLCSIFIPSAATYDPGPALCVPAVRLSPVVWVISPAARGSRRSNTAGDLFEDRCGWIGANSRPTSRVGLERVYVRRAGRRGRSRGSVARPHFSEVFGTIFGMI